MSELVRQALGALINPLVLGLLLGAAALCARLTQRRRAAAVLGTVATLLVYLCALPPVGAALLRPLEMRYRTPGAIDGVRKVVVLGSGYAPRVGVSSVTAEDREGLVRIVEGVRIARGIPGVRLILSGGAPPGREPAAYGYARLARDLGMDPAALVVLDRARNTAAEATAIHAALGSEPFLLITSASHMPRAMRLMERSGAQAIPVPTGQETDLPCHFDCLLPSCRGLGMTERALHEYLGLVALDLHLQ
jgi:uncharacterized SAM-binding protein YcdF (DUF218 family)